MLLNNSYKFSFFFLVFILSCSSDKEENKNVMTSQPVANVKITDTSNFANNINAYDSKVGALGVFEVPEMLVLSLLDSAKKEDLPERLVKNYSILEKDLNAVAAEMNGPIGMISYNNSPDNYIFESLICIKQIPKKQPANSKIVILEASKMLVFNFYGPYQNLFSAYDKIERHCKKNDLMQSGPIREFYITDPEIETNPEKWLTRIFLPVIEMGK